MNMFQRHKSKNQTKGGEGGHNLQNYIGMGMGQTIGTGAITPQTEINPHVSSLRTHAA